MFPVIGEVVDGRKLSPGAYDLLDFVPNKDTGAPSLKARISNYTTGPFPADHKTRALVFGDESARISGKVVVNPDGTKRFEKVEIKPFDTNFDFHDNKSGLHVEIQRGEYTILKTMGPPMTLNIADVGGLMSRVQIGESGESTIPSRTRS